ncbi:MAG TPA: class I SAM-dependent methyltransferase [Methanothrix sp.]|nr:class I SAM-dependent methyltransferase [Methanothrix sp.]
MIENGGVRVREARCCLLCGGEGVQLYSDLRDRLFGAPGIWSLMKCSKCQLVWLNPQPISDDVGKLYARYFTHEELCAHKRALMGLRETLKANILKASYGYQMNGSNRMLELILSNIGPLVDIAGGGVLYLKACEIGRLLDVGCGNGLFLDQMRRLGWEVVGVEPDEKAASVAVEKLELEVFCGSLKDAKFPDGHFDAITMNHVIEHATDPLELLKECRRILRPGGKLVVVTPNIESLGRRVFGNAWLHWDPPRHLFLFSSEILRKLAELAGLVILEMRTTAKGARGVLVESNLIKRDGTRKGDLTETPVASLRLQGLAFQAIEHGLCRCGKVGEELVMVATI